MFYSQRLEEILRILEKRHSASVHYLASQLYVSEPTVRRDLAELEKEGKIKRTYGGAVLSSLINQEIPLVLREQENVEEKKRLAEQALQYIRNDQTLFLDASSTVYHIVEHLSTFSDLTVITNSPKVSLKLAEMKIRCFCTGGLLLENSIAYVGTLAENFIRNFNADLVLFSCRGISETGELTDSSPEESVLRQAMLARAKQKICLSTADKLGNKYLYNLCHARDIDAILTTVPLPDFQ